MLGSLTDGYTVQPFEFAYARQNPKQYLQQRFRCGADYTSCLSRIVVNLPADVVFQGESVGIVKEIIEFIRSIPAHEGKPNNGSHAVVDQVPG
jgi:isocitrate dehydrogenase kinase/phosphatase